MSRRKLDLTFVVATKDRPDDLRKMFASLAGQSRAVSQVVIVDASAEPVEAVASEFPSLNVRYLRHLPPSAAKQRNAGVAVVDERIGLIGFLDDDAVLEPDAVEKMLDFWQEAPTDLGGASFNMLNPPMTGGRWLKRSRLCAAMGLYRRGSGRVAPSGWQTVTETVSETCFVDWLATGAVVWRRDVLKDFRLDDYFEGYSYLEDLDFSLSVGKRFKMAVVADARYSHYPSPGGRTSSYAFGKVEARNRLYVVKKHGLSLWRCLLGLGIRMGMTLAAATRHANGAAFHRACGNVVGVVQGFASSGTPGREKTRCEGKTPSPPAPLPRTGEGSCGPGPLPQAGEGPCVGPARP